MNATAFKEAVRHLAVNEAGYDLAGFAPLRISAEDQAHLEAFAREGYSAGMDWFARHLNLRQDPAQLFPGARSALVLATYYRDQACEELLAEATLRVSRYAAGRDYHRLLRKKGARLLDEIQRLWREHIPGDSARLEAGDDPAGLTGRVVVDSAPVPEKILARMAGLGWQGKHTNLIHPELGSYFFLSVILLNVELPGDGPVADLCGSCRLCVDACPTGALFQDYRLDAGRCISYLTIERDETQPINASFAAAVSHRTENLENASVAEPDFQGWVFGCDICQEVCPYNRSRRSRDRQTAEPAFILRPALRDFLSRGSSCQKETAEISAEDFAALSPGSPLARAGHAKLRQNIEHAAHSGGEGDS